MARVVGKVLTATKIYFDSSYFNPTLVGTLSHYHPDTLTVTYGTLDTGTVSDLAAVGGTDVNISEASGANALLAVLDFPGVVIDDNSNLEFEFFGNYNGGATHSIQIEVYNTGTTNWDSIGFITTSASKGWYSFTIFNPSAYVSSGDLSLRFRHIDAGVITHDLILDFTVIRVGGGASQVTRFTSLSDVPHSYTSQADKYVKVNAGATGLEFITFPGLLLTGGTITGNFALSSVLIPTEANTAHEGQTIIILDSNAQEVSVTIDGGSSYPSSILFVKCIDVTNGASLVGTIDNGSNYTFSAVNEGLLLIQYNDSWHIIGKCTP